MRLIARVILLLLVIITAFKLCMDVRRIAASLNLPDIISSAIGETTVSLLLCIVFFWSYRKLAPRNNDGA